MLRKFVAAVSLLGLTLPANADSESVKVLSSEVHRLIIERADDLSRRKLDSIMSSLEEIKALLNGGSVGREMVVTGTVESTSFTFIGSSTREILDQCTAFYERNNFGSVDDVTVKVNGGRLHTYHTGGWWRTADEVCRQVFQGLIDSNAIPPKDLVVTGKIEDREFLFIAENVAAIRSQCIDFYGRSGLGSVDDVSASVNGSSVDARHTGGWWRTADEVCNVVVDIVIANGGLSGDDLVVSGTIEDRSFLFISGSIRDINEQCFAFYAASGFGSVDDITVVVNGGERQTFHTGGWWRTPEEVCTIIIGAIPLQ